MSTVSRVSARLRGAGVARWGWPWALLVFVALLAVYVRTLLPGVLGGDAGELQYAGPLLALVHPTGQPLHVVLGCFWSNLLSLGTAA